MTPARLLVIEDDAALRDLVARGLREEGFTVATAADAAGALRLALAGCDALVVDIGLPDADGRDLCQALRARGVSAPVLFLTARHQVSDRLAGFAAGGDDYLTKPFHFTELTARLRALLRRSTAAATTDTGGLRLDPATHAIAVGALSAPLTPTEYRLLGALVTAPGTVVRRRELVRAGWPDGALVHDNTLDQYIARLRRKLREVESISTIETAHGVGYRYA
jgi:DNA-binding response OmpR family regulator